MFCGARFVGRNPVAAMERHRDLHHVVPKLIQPVLRRVKVRCAIGALPRSLRLTPATWAVAVVMDNQRVAACLAADALASVTQIPWALRVGTMRSIRPRANAAERDGRRVGGSIARCIPRVPNRGVKT